MSLLLLILGIGLFVGLVVVHEWGHFIVARWSGVDVEEFGIGFPPRAKILSKKKGTIYSLNWLPLGGFVKLKGEHDADSAPGTFGAAKTSDKIKIMLAGVVMNLVAAFVLLTFLALVGIPKLIDNQFTVASDTKVTQHALLASYIEPNSPASQAGLKDEDRIISVNSIIVNSETRLKELTKQFAGQSVDVVIMRAGHSQTITTNLRTQADVEASRNTDNPKGYLGVAPTAYIVQRSTWSAPIVAFGLIKQFSVLTFQGLGSAVKGLGSIVAGFVTGNKTARQNGQTASTSQVSGPVGIVVLMKHGSLLGYQFMLMIVAIISLTLAIINVLPIPALDGGRLFVMLLFRALRRPLKQSTEERIHGTGFALLMVLIVLITIVDIKRNF